MGDDGHTWEPLSVGEAVDLFGNAPFRWWISGGHALELHAQHAWRPHDDLDVGVTREQTLPLHRWLSDWDLFVASSGRLSEWDGRPLSEERHENNVWARRTRHTWAFDLAIGSGTACGWSHER